MKFAELAVAAHALARKNGFYDAPETDVQFVKRWCLNLQGELAEIWEAARKGKLNKECDKALDMRVAGLPVLYCAAEELADVEIRLADGVARLGIPFEFCGVDCFHPQNYLGCDGTGNNQTLEDLLVSANVMVVHIVTRSHKEAPPSHMSHPGNVSGLYNVNRAIAAKLGIDLDLAVEAKHAFNATRPFRHGGTGA